MNHDFYFDFASWQAADLHIRLVLPSPRQASALFAIIDRCRDDLSKWMPWPGKIRTEADERQHLQACLRDFAAGRSFSLTILGNDQPAGMIDLHNFKAQGAEIGYWLDPDFRGGGIVTQAVKILCQYAFVIRQLKEVRILTLPENISSQRVAERCDFKFIGQVGSHFVYRLKN